MPDLSNPIPPLLATLAPLADPARAAHAQGYTPSAREVLGLSVPQLRDALRPWRAALAKSPPGQAIAALEALQAAPVFELQIAAWDLLSGLPKLRRQIPAATLLRWAGGNDNWAAVDAYCCGVLGPAWREGQVDDAALLAWTRSPDRWLRRSAVVCTVALNLAARGGRGDSARTLAICARVAEDRDPMVVKALSWALRALIGHDRPGVERFLDEHAVAAQARREVETKLRTGRKNPRASKAIAKQR